jgi:hypothetical protein
MSPSAEPAASAGATVLAVVVVYGRAWDAAASMPLLRRWAGGYGSAEGAPQLVEVLVWDNSPTPSGSLPPQGGPVVRVADPSNGGTRAAYAAAAARAAAIGVDWVLLLDQDTRLPDAFPSAVGAALRTPGAAALAALVPRVLHGGALVSPSVITAAGTVVPRRLDAPGGRAGVPSAIASGTLLRTADAVAMQPVPPEFWLDYLDHWIFLRLHARGRPIGAIDCDIDHHLSVLDPASMGPVRFANLLRAERRFVAELPLPARLGHRGRLLLRAARLAGRAPGLARLALRAALGVAA